MMYQRSLQVFSLFLCACLFMPAQALTPPTNDLEPRQIKIEATIEIHEKTEDEITHSNELTIGLMTTENTQAVIEKGFEIALQGLPAVNQAAGNEFRSAMLRLQIRPSITNAGHVLLQSEIQLDEPMQEDFVLFLKRRLFTTNLLKNQSTELIGHIHEKTGKEQLEIEIYLTPTIIE